MNQPIYDPYEMSAADLRETETPKSVWVPWRLWFLSHLAGGLAGALAFLCGAMMSRFLVQQDFEMQEVNREFFVFTSALAGVFALSGLIVTIIWIALKRKKTFLRSAMVQVLVGLGLLEATPWIVALLLESLELENQITACVVILGAILTKNMVVAYLWLRFGRPKKPGRDGK